MYNWKTDDGAKPLPLVTKLEWTNMLGLYMISLQKSSTFFIGVIMTFSIPLS